VTPAWPAVDNTPRRPIAGRWVPWLGALLCAHALLQAGLKLSAGSPGQLLWVCHVSLLLGGVALLCRSRLWLTTSLLLCAVVHVLWWGDLAGWAALGAPPLGIVAYLQKADALAWLGTSYHLYTLPVLGAVAWRAQVFHRQAVPSAMALSLVLLVVSRALTPAELNINRAFAVGVDAVPLARGLDALPGNVYLLALGVAFWALGVGPAALVLWVHHNAGRDDAGTQPRAGAGKRERRRRGQRIRNRVNQSAETALGNY